MRLWNPFRRRETRLNIESPSTPLSAANLETALGGGGDYLITEEKALSIPAVWAAVDFLSSSLAGLPLKVFTRGADGERVEQMGVFHRMLNRAPNPAQSAYDWRKYFWERVLLHGRCYTIIRRTGGGNPAELWTPDPVGMQVEREEGKIKYTLYDEEVGKGAGMEVDPADVIDVAWIMRGDGVRHYSPLHRLGKTLKQGIGAIEYGARFFQNGGMAHFALTGPMTTQGGLDRAIADMTAALQNMAAKGGQVIALPVGHELTPISSTPEQTQMIEAQRFTVEQVARAFGMPPTMLQDWRRSTYANMEQGDVHVVKHTLSKWARRFEQQINLKLFGANSERRYVEHSMAGVMRGDLKSRAEALARQIQTGQLTPNEARALENREAMDGGDDLLIQGATVPLKDQGKEEDAGAAGGFPMPGGEDNETEDDGEKPGASDDKEK